MTTKRDYYEILGVAKNATPEELKKAYRKMALDWHPDRHQENKKGAEEKFKGINEAYEILSNPEKKAAYDQFGHAAFEAGGMGAGGPFGGGFGHGRTSNQGPFSYYHTSGQGGQQFEFDLGGFSDPFEIFEQFFGGSPFGRQAPRKPVYSLKIDFLESVKGCEKEVEVSGKRKKLKIPPGVYDGARIRFDDFDVVVEVRPDSTFQRHGDDLIISFPVSFAQAALGDVVSVSTIDGPVKLRVQPGTQPGAVIRLRGKGVPNLRSSGRGDQYVRLKIEIPQKLTRRQREILEEFAVTERGRGESGKRKTGWF